MVININYYKLNCTVWNIKSIFKYLHFSFSFLVNMMSAKDMVKVMIVMFAICFLARSDGKSVK